MFAAGDLNDGQEEQVIIAAAEGAKTALAAFHYLVNQARTGPICARNDPPGADPRIAGAMGFSRGAVTRTG